MLDKAGLTFACRACGGCLPQNAYRTHKRGYRVGKCRQCERDYQREWYASQGERAKKLKRDFMARLRAKDPVAALQKKRDYLSIQKNRDRMNARRREWHEKRFFYSRANRSHFRAAGVTAKHLASLWKAQRGICALTGERLDRSAEIDHRIPIARGGPDTIKNLRWVSGTANRLKRDLTDEELVAFCNSVVAWLGLRLNEAFKK